MPKRIALLAAGHLSSCPRMIKEAELLSSNGYEISIVYLSSVAFVTELDRYIISQHKNWIFHEVSWGFSVNKVISQVYSKLFNFFNSNLNFIQPTSKLLIDKTLQVKADLYIAHHPSVLVAASLAAKKYNAKFAYDIEDAFAFVEDGRFVDNPDSKIIDIEKRYLPGALIITSASPLYIDLYLKIYRGIVKPIRLLNVFNFYTSLTSQEFKDRKDPKKISLYWISQTVGLNRGLQDIFRALPLLIPNSFELHIRGNCNDEDRVSLLSLISDFQIKQNVFFHPLVSHDQIISRNSEHDIGLVLEKSISLNKEYCITNKIFDYMRSGIAIISTKTKGNESIISEYSPIQNSYNSGDVVELANIINQFIINRELLSVAKDKSKELARSKYNWVLESKEWLNQIKEVLN